MYHITQVLCRDPFKLTQMGPCCLLVNDYGVTPGDFIVTVFTLLQGDVLYDVMEFNIPTLLVSSRVLKLDNVKSTGHYCKINLSL